MSAGSKDPAGEGTPSSSAASAAGGAGAVSSTAPVATASARPAKHRSIWREYLEAFVMAAVLALGIRSFIIQGYRIPSPSMEDTLLVGDWLFVNKFLFGAEIPFTGLRLPAIRQPHRGDIIVFRYPKNPKEDYIKRCVAVEGDTLLYKNKVLYVNGVAQKEPFVHFADGDRIMASRDFFGPVVVPKGQLFMMGDNRDRSSDSRFWGFMDKRLIRGKALFIYFSWDGEHKRVRFSRFLNAIR
jgi:signal peptidase I